MLRKDEAWEMIRKNRHWKLWETLKRENKLRFNVTFEKGVNIPTWKSFNAMQLDKF